MRTCARPTSSTSRTYPSMDFVSTGAQVDKGEMLVDGDLTIRGVTKPVTFEFEFGGFGPTRGATTRPAPLRRR